jgi:hypothetical protein
MRLGLGLGFLHRLITVAEEAVAKYLLLEDSDFLMLETPLLLVTEDNNTLITQGGSSLAGEQSDASGKIELEQ